MSERVTTRLRHNMVELALHELRPGSADAHPLLIVHGLGESTPATAPAWTAPWPGSVFGLDLTGHGESDVPDGGGYTPEVLMADVDTAVAALGPSTLVGRGLGAYLCLLLAGARPRVVRGAVLADGPGLAGGTSGPPSPTLLTVPPDEEGQAPDPWALAELTRDVRPRDYAVTFARSAVQQSGLETPVVVTARYRPPWLQAVAAEPGIVEDTIEGALTRLA